MKPDISIYGTASRPENWMEVIETIGDNEVSWDMIFVGPNLPVCEMPKNFRFIQTFVKPSQCLEIGARATTADLIMNLTDDVLIKTPNKQNPLDKLYQTYQEQNNEKVFVSCRFMLRGEDCSLTCHRFFQHDQSSPVLGVCCLKSRKYYMELGGLDRKFIAMSGDTDMHMRVHVDGGEIILSEDVYVDEVAALSRGSWVATENWAHDRTYLLEGLWTKPGPGIFGKVITFERTMSFESFSDERILEESQGPKGRWV